jgi:hypothetical protein
MQTLEVFMSKKGLYLLSALLLFLLAAVAVGQARPPGGVAPENENTVSADFPRETIDEKTEGTEDVLALARPVRLTIEIEEAQPEPAETPEAPVAVESRIVANRSRASTPPPAPAEPAAPAPAPVKESAPAADPGIDYTTYTVRAGDSFWSIAQQAGIPMPDLLRANQMTEGTPLNAGMTLIIPRVTVPVKTTPGPQYGELVDWWTEAQYIWPMGQNARIIDFRTGQSFMVRRSYGAFHADVEPLTAEDTRIMKSIWGNWSWATRPVIVEVNGRRLAGSANGMPHSIQTINTNNFDGHFCIHFLNSTRHKDNLMQADHQQNVRTAAGQ